MKILLPDHKRWVYDSPMDVRWGDMDSLGQLVIVGIQLDIVKFRSELTLSNA